MGTEKEIQEETQENLPVNGVETPGKKSLESEMDLTEHGESHEQEEHDQDHEEKEAVDYSQLSKAQLVEVIKSLSKDDDFKKVDRILNEIKPLFDSHFNKQREEALARFIAEGSQETDFEYRGDEFDSAFDANFKLIKDKKHKHYKNIESQKQENLAKKQELLERLRLLIESQETGDQFDSFKNLQREWKSIGSVPAAMAKSIWANFHALQDRFYDNQSIYYELKELDRKKNLELKEELCVRAEKLLEVTILKDAIRELNELHHEFKHIGPVPLEEKENIWQRFKKASDALYEKRDGFMETLQVELKENLVKKNELCEEVATYTEFSSDRIKEWNTKTKAILELQKRWEAIGGVPRSQSKEINHKFWGAFKQFFSNKNSFFKKLDETRQVNLKAKNDLVQRALALKDSQDWDKTTEEFKRLQQQWKEMGPVPEKFREKIYKEFKEACDYFFEQRRKEHGKVESDQHDNLVKKKAICEAMEKEMAEGTVSQEHLQNHLQQFNEIGFVPRKDINKIKKHFHDVMTNYVAAIPNLSEEERERVSMESSLEELRNDPRADQKIFQKEQTIRKKIGKVENDIAVLKNNLEFFGRSKNAIKYKEEFSGKIEEANDHLKQLKQQLKILRTVS